MTKIVEISRGDHAACLSCGKEFRRYGHKTNYCRAKKCIGKRAAEKTTDLRRKSITLKCQSCDAYFQSRRQGVKYCRDTTCLRARTARAERERIALAGGYKPRMKKRAPAMPLRPVSDLDFQHTGFFQGSNTK